MVLYCSRLCLSETILFVYNFIHQCQIVWNSTEKTTETLIWFLCKLYGFNLQNIDSLSLFLDFIDRDIVVSYNAENVLLHGPLTRYVKLQVAHAPGMPGTFSHPPQVRDPDMHHGTCVTHVPWCMPGSLTSVFLWGRWRGKRSRHSHRMRNPQFCVSGKRPWKFGKTFLISNISRLSAVL